MSEEQLKAFIAKVQADSSLQEQLKAEGADVVAIAKAAGFSITTEDWDQRPVRTLSDEELEGAAGGCCITGESPGSAPTNDYKCTKGRGPGGCY
ncbi:possible Formyl transferase [Prochlorococcus marinus str. MIT 9313]|uniref:Possible Formyl transferase n=1 Tax=Prochlorococcus marinus (strain MIT 9313) TaxID=74547 RepID=Q7TUK2_PROMM|nr:Nif11-like leader peptide family natural product precursor [Prochlorococcus marinus]CAE22308.1 possible Formyl transferase [Prochlorococcus marinus str. MIT 9313]